MQLEGDKAIDVLSTAQEQTKWNGWAACATALAALAQALSLMAG